MTSRDEAYTQLLSLAVHEMRTPVSVVGGYLRMLQRDADAPLNPRHRKMVDEAERSCQRIVALIAELSDIQKLDADMVQLARQPIDLFPLLDDVARGVHEPDERNVRLEVHGVSAGASMRGDSNWLRRAFSAIFRAILRELPSGATAVAERRLERTGDGTAAIVIVAEEQAVQRSYEARPVPFDEKRGGLGLSLPMARRVIERHGGRVWSPAADGGRAVALVSLPIEGSST
jgi:signal transduction histidine kinase